MPASSTPPMPMAQPRRAACPRCASSVALLGSSDRQIAHRCAHGLVCIPATGNPTVPACGVCSSERAIGSGVVPSSPEPANDRDPEALGVIQIDGPPVWLKSYQAFNASLMQKQAAEDLGSSWAPRERIALARRIRAIASGCSDKASILKAIDEVIEGMTYTTPRKL